MCAMGHWQHIIWGNDWRSTFPNVVISDIVRFIADCSLWILSAVIEWSFFKNYRAWRKCIGNYFTVLFGFKKLFLKQQTLDSKTHYTAYHMWKFHACRFFPTNDQWSFNDTTFWYFIGWGRSGHRWTVLLSINVLCILLTFYECQKS